MDNALFKVNDMGLKSELEKLFDKVKGIVERLQTQKDENRILKDKLKELEQNLAEIRLDYSNKSSELLSKDKEVSELKNKLLDERKNKISSDEKAMLKSRIRELMIRLDAHLEQKANNNF